MHRTLRLVQAEKRWKPQSGDLPHVPELEDVTLREKLVELQPSDSRVNASTAW
jgi:hypothetical protein